MNDISPLARGLGSIIEKGDCWFFPKGEGDWSYLLMAPKPGQHSWTTGERVRFFSTDRDVMFKVDEDDDTELLTPADKAFLYEIYERVYVNPWVEGCRFNEIKRKEEHRVRTEGRLKELEALGRAT